MSCDRWWIVFTLNWGSFVVELGSLRESPPVPPGRRSLSFAGPNESNQSKGPEYDLTVWHGGKRLPTQSHEKLNHAMHAATPLLISQTFVGTADA